MPTPKSSGSRNAQGGTTFRRLPVPRRLFSPVGRGRRSVRVVAVFMVITLFCALAAAQLISYIFDGSDSDWPAGLQPRGGLATALTALTGVSRSVYRPIPGGVPPELRQSTDECRRFYEVVGAEEAEKQKSKVASTPDSTILMTFAAGDPPQYRYVPPLSSAGVGGGQCTPLHDAGYLGGGFARVAASQLSTPYAASAAAGGDADAVVPFFDFFRSHGATLWEVREGAAERVAAPLQMDVVYTYVNPTAPSFARHLQQRGIPFNTERRYNDWEELRYSLRTLHKRILNSDAVRQFPSRLKEDVGALEALGYRVDLSTRRTPWNRNGTAAAPGDALSGDAFPLFRTVYLLLSDEDQVPAWLNAAAFPQLRVVTHRDLFQNDPGVLPTLNSNTIESGLHRIPGISRHFLYVNNDHMIGRELSLFDLFRPLSPSRQQLRVVHDELTADAPSDIRMQQGRSCAEALGSRFVYMEPIMHSHTTDLVWEDMYRKDPERKKRAETRGRETRCLHDSARVAVQTAMESYAETVSRYRKTRSRSASSASAHVKRRLFRPDGASAFLGRRGFTTRYGFAVPEIIGNFAVPKGQGLSAHYYYGKVMNHLEGVRPPWGYPHMPLLVDRAVYHAIAEEVFRDDVQQTRLAYERERYPFSIVDLYAPTALAFARAAAREQWGRVMALMSSSSSSGGGVHAAVAGWLAAASGRVVAAAEAGALHLPRESRALSEEAMAALGPLYGGSWGVRLQAPELLPGELGLWWLPGARPAHVERRTEDSLRPLYAVPDLVVVRRDGSVPSQAATYPRIVENYWALYHDIVHHAGPNRIYRFSMLETAWKALLMTQRCVEESPQTSLWMGFNDNFNVDSASDEVVDGVRAAMKVLLLTCTESLPAGVWEQ